MVVAAWAGEGELPVGCPWRRLTGRRCPACGLTRSVALAWRGRVRDSVDAHPLGVVLLAVIFVRVLSGKVWRATPRAAVRPLRAESSRADRPDGRAVVYSRGSE
ncbi:DUF2752 domain-containing protein [Pseudonocardia sulfidoxydans]|uniref:DUF2752 domain-containing protein n=1 Tax=Pseudonocardia sulfidoxydans TaxID=54011 RepID=UPI0035A260BD